MNLLTRLKNPSDLKSLEKTQLNTLASEICDFLIESVSETGGHIGANLGVIELTIALHYAFDFGPKTTQDKLLFDIGHQGYTHKILTGRLDQFGSLNQIGGMSRFLSNKESVHDLLDASHAGTVLSIACGLVKAQARSESVGRVVAFIGDGSLVEGMAFEGLNYVSELQLPLIIVINDNGMSIPPNIGGIHKLFSSPDWEIASRLWFEGMGLSYFPVSDGHDFEQLLGAINQAKANLSPTIIHVKTQKGRGLEIAKEHPYKLHFSMPFNPVSGQSTSISSAGVSFPEIVGAELESRLVMNPDIFVLSPATPYASGIEKLVESFPDNVFDVGMAEQHTLGMAAGLAMAGKKVFACFQSTFLQRAIDQIIHDICYPNHDVTIISARSGFAGFDGPTHHGIYDFGILGSLPRLSLFYAGTPRDLKAIIKARCDENSAVASGPLVILHPYENFPNDLQLQLPERETPIEEVEVYSPGGPDLVICAGNCLQAALLVKRKLLETGNDFSVINLRWISPLPSTSLLPHLKAARRVLVIEESLEDSGLGKSLTQLVSQNSLDLDVYLRGIRTPFVPAGDKNYLAKYAGIDAENIFEEACRHWL